MQSSNASNIDKPVGILITILSAFGILGTILVSIIFGIFTSFVTAQAVSASGKPEIFHAFPFALFGVFGAIGMVIAIVEFAALVWAGLGIMKSQRLAFIVALVVAGVSLVSGAPGMLGLLILVYCGLRIGGALGPAPV